MAVSLIEARCPWHCGWVRWEDEGRREGELIMPKLLVIDDEANIRFSIAAVFEGADIRVLGAATAEEGLQVAADESPEVVLLDIVLGTTSGLDLFHELRRIDPKMMIVFITGCGTAETAIEAMKLGAYDYLVKPLDAAQLEQVVRQAFQISRLMHVPALMDVGDRPEDKPDRLVGSSAKIQTVCKQIGRVAAQDINVLILGESGTGKELVARAIYHHSRRNQAPFLAINCAAIPETLLESELFGHERGSFTGADRKRIGKFEQCHTGTLFLDEIGDMAPPTQAKILRLLQEGSFERVGGNEMVTSDVRIIAATNQDLDRLIEEGRFRKDLYYRLRGVTLQIPALRERREDIPELAHYFLFRYNRERERPCNPSRPKRWSCWSDTTGQATSANCRASSEKPWSPRPVRPSCPSSCPPNCTRTARPKRTANPSRRRTWIGWAWASSSTPPWREARPMCTDGRKITLTGWCSRELSRKPGAINTGPPRSSVSAALRCGRSWLDGAFRRDGVPITGGQLRFSIRCAG